MDSMQENYAEKWHAMRREYDAKADRLSAEKRMEYTDAFDNFGAEVSAVADWSAASWEEMTAKIDRKWQDMAIDRQDNSAT